MTTRKFTNIMTALWIIASELTKSEILEVLYGAIAVFYALETLFGKKPE